jgi:hypothetical protein
MAMPWAEAGYECWCIDIQHSIRRQRDEVVGRGVIHFTWGDVRSFRRPTQKPIAFFGAFPFCTNDSVSGARDFELKGGMMLRDGLECFESCRSAASWSGAPYFVEHPVTMLTSIPHIGKPNHYFDPCDFAGYLDEPATDAYTKKTCIWTGNGFVMPEKRRVDPVMGSAMWKLPPSDDRADMRSKTPRGFARATFLANAACVTAAKAA